MPSLPIQSWLDLEERFRALSAEASLQGLRLDFQWGSAGEHWNLTGVQRGVKYQEAEALSALAGQAVNFALEGKSVREKKILSERDPVRRWFKTVVHLGGITSDPRIAHQVDEDGNRTGPIYSATVQKYLAVSANLCLHLASICPIRDPRSWLEKLYEDFGKEIVIGVIIALIATILGVVLGA